MMHLTKSDYIWEVGVAPLTQSCDTTHYRDIQRETEERRERGEVTRGE